MHHFKSFLLALLCLFSVGANAQSHGPDGPFYNVYELTDAWAQFHQGHTNWLYLDGNLISSGVGWGPAVTGQYYNCPDGLIHHDECPSTAPVLGCSCSVIQGPYATCELYNFTSPHSLSSVANAYWNAYGWANFISQAPNGLSATIQPIFGQGGYASAYVILNDNSAQSVTCPVRSW
jgi:hypothetical protein